MNFKRTTYITLSIFILWSAQATAQSYRQNKKVFNSRDYVRQDGDRYSPALAGITSFVLPGLGQAISGEPLRGLGFFGGALVSVAVVGVGASLLIDGILFGDSDTAIPGKLLFYSGLGGYLNVDIWAVFDAVKVAKVNNMYRQSRNLGLKISPFLSNQNYLAQAKPAAGITLGITF